VAARNKVFFDHPQCLGLDNELVLANGAIAVANSDVIVGKLILGTTEYTSGTFSAPSHPDFIQGEKSITVGGTSSQQTMSGKIFHYHSNTLFFNGKYIDASIFSLSGSRIVSGIKTSEYKVNNLQPGIYIVKYTNDGYNGVEKFKVQ
jgi:hypothetical protein